MDRGEIVRVAPGSYASAAAWSRLKPIEQHCQRVWEAASRTEPGTVFSHFAVAALRGVDIMGDWPELVDVCVARTSGGRSTGRLRRHTRSLDGLGLEPWGDHFITSAVQTAIDLAAAMPFTQVSSSPIARSGHGESTARSPPRRSLWPQPPGSPAEVRCGRCASRNSRHPNPTASARRAVGSQSIDSGFRHRSCSTSSSCRAAGASARDIYWPEWDHVGEFDGIGKYLDPAILQGRSPQQALIEEKDREDELRRVVRGLSRWRTPQLDRLALLYDILTRAGLPTALRRPGF